LLKALKDKEDDVRAFAVLTLGKFRNPTTFDDIANLLLDDPKIEVRQAVIYAFDETKTPVSDLPNASLARFILGYERGEGPASDLLQAIENMRQDAVGPLIEALSNAEGTVRKFAAILLERIGDERAIESLGMAIYDLHFDVGHAAASLEALQEALTHPKRASANMPSAPSEKSNMQASRHYCLKHSLTLSVSSENRRFNRSVNCATRALLHLQEIAANRIDRELAALAKQALQKIQ